MFQNLVGLKFGKSAKKSLWKIYFSNLLAHSSSGIGLKTHVHTASFWPCVSLLCVLKTLDSDTYIDKRFKI